MGKRQEIARSDREFASDPVSPAADRLARVVWQARSHQTDFRNGPGLAEASSASYGAIRKWCLAAKVDGRMFILFARFFRAVWLASKGGHNVADLLDIVDPSVLNRDLKTAGIRNLPASIEAYCLNQTFLQPACPTVTRVISLLREDQALR